MRQTIQKIARLLGIAILCSLSIALAFMTIVILQAFMQWATAENMNYTIVIAALSVVNGLTIYKTLKNNSIKSIDNIED